MNANPTLRMDLKKNASRQGVTWYTFTNLHAARRTWSRLPYSTTGNVVPCQGTNAVERDLDRALVPSDQAHLH